MEKSNRTRPIVLVTGATGLLGNNVVRRLAEQGYPVRALVRSRDDLRPFAGLPVELHQGNVVDLAVVRNACQGAAAVVHAAGVVRIGWTSAGGMSATNVLGTGNVALAAREVGARLVHVSSVNSLALLDDPTAAANEQTPWTGKEVSCDYVRTKRAADQQVAEQIAGGLDAVCIHPGFMLGPWDWKPSSGRMLLAVATKSLPLAPSGGVSVCDVRDVAETVVRACFASGLQRKYIVAGRNITYRELWNEMAEVTGGRKPWATMGPIVRWIVGSSGDFAAWITRQEGDVNSAALQMSRKFHYYDSSQAERDLGYRTRDLRESLADAWNWLRQYHATDQPTPASLAEPRMS